LGTKAIDLRAPVQRKLGEREVSGKKRKELRESHARNGANAKKKKMLQPGEGSRARGGEVADARKDKTRNCTTQKIKKTFRGGRKKKKNKYRKNLIPGGKILTKRVSTATSEQLSSLRTRRGGERRSLKRKRV